MDYSKLTTEQFDEILEEIVGDLVEARGAGNLLTIPGVYEVLAEYFNNAVLDRWETRQQEAKEDA